MFQKSIKFCVLFISLIALVSCRDNVIAEFEIGKGVGLNEGKFSISRGGIDTVNQTLGPVHLEHSMNPVKTTLGKLNIDRQGNYYLGLYIKRGKGILYKDCLLVISGWFLYGIYYWIKGIASK